jgi:hypothetical protein
VANDDICRHNLLFEQLTFVLYLSGIHLHSPDFITNFALHFPTLWAHFVSKCEPQGRVPQKDQFKIKDKTRHTIHIHYLPFWPNCNIKQRRHSVKKFGIDNDADLPGNFLVGEHGCDFCHYRFHLVLSWTGTAFNIQYNV